MFEIGWTELLLIGVVALIVIGPRDLPEMFRQMGRFTGKMRGMARDFQRAMDQAANETGLKDVARDLKAAGSMKPSALNAVKEAASKFEKWDPLQNSARPAPPVVTTAAPAAATTAATATTTPGPETQALLDAQAKRQAIIAESTERLRAVSARPVPTASVPAPVLAPAPEPAVDAPKAARKARAKVAKAEADPAETGAPEKPKKPRKTSAKADQA